MAGHSSCRRPKLGQIRGTDYDPLMAKGQERPQKGNKPKLSTKEKQQKKKEKKAAKAGG